MSRDGSAMLSAELFECSSDLLGDIDKEAFRDIECSSHIIISRQHRRFLSRKVPSIERSAASVEDEIAHLQYASEVTPDNVHPVDIDVERV